MLAVFLSDFRIFHRDVKGLEVFGAHEANGVLMHVGVGADLLRVIPFVEGPVELAGKHEAVVMMRRGRGHSQGENSLHWLLDVLPG